MSRTVEYILIGVIGVFVLPRVALFIADRIHSYIHADHQEIPGAATKTRG